MPIDFSNRDPKDKNGVFSIEPASTPAWLNAKDWSGFTRDPAQKAGKQEVGWATVTLNDGRKFRAILGPGGQPLAELGDPFETDDKRAQAFSTATTQAATAASQAARNKTSVYQGVFPEGHPRAGRPATITEYETGDPDYVEITTAAATGAPPAGTPTQVQTEGTIDPSAPDGRDNTRPVKASHWPNGTVTYEPLSPAEMTVWRKEQGIPEPGAKPDVGQPTGNTRQKTEGATTVKETEYLLPNGTREWRTQAESAAPTAAQQVGSPTGNTRERDEGGAKIKETEYVLPNGSREWRVQTAAGEKPGRKEEEIVNLADHKTYIKVTTTDPATNQVRIFHLDPATRQEVTLPGSAMAGIKGLPSYTPDLTKPGAGLIDRAKQLDEMMAAGQLTWEQRQEILGQDQVLAQTVASEFNAGVSLLQSNYANQTSQRNVDVSNVQHRASLANSHMQNAIGLMEHFAPYLGNTKGATGKLFMSAMAAQLGLATQYGGMQNIPREQMDPAVADWAHRAVAGARGAAPPVSGAAPPVSGAAPAVSGAAPAVSGAAPSVTSQAGVPASGVAPTLGPARTRFDTGPGNTLGPRVMTPASATGGMPPPPQGYEPALSWRAGAQQQEDVLLPPDPNAVGTGEMAFGSLLPPVAPTDPMGGPMDFGAGVGSAPLAMRSSIPGLTPEQDEQARRELDRQIFAGARG